MDKKLPIINLLNDNVRLVIRTDSIEIIIFADNGELVLENSEKSVFAYLMNDNKQKHFTRRLTLIR